MLARCPASRRNDLVLRHFPDGSVVYDEASGGLHALSPVAAQVLELILANEGLSPLSLAAALELDDPSADELEQVESMVRGLESLGFVDCQAA